MPADKTDSPAVEDWDELFVGLQQEPRKKRWIWLVYLFLFAAAIPWYWPLSYRGSLVVGLPMWVAVTVATTVLLASWTVFVIAKYWRDPSDADGARE
jgi:hypothetical protein